MRKLVAVVAAGLLGLGLLALGTSPASAELKTSITGSIRLNAHLVDVIANNGGSEEIGPTDLPFTAGFRKVRETDNSQFMIDARRTRLQLDMSDQVGSIKISGRLQGDFDTSDGTATTSNGRHFRIRLGWGQWQTPGGWIVRFGQMRTLVSEYGDNLFGGVADADIVDEQGHWDQLQGRQPGVHIGYLMKMMGGDLIVGGGVEKSSSSVTNNDVHTPSACTTNPPLAGGASGAFDQACTSLVNPAQGTGEDQPLFGAAARWRNPLYAVFLRGASQKHKIIFGHSDDPTSRKVGDAMKLTGWLAALGAEVTPGPLRVYAQYWYGNGLNRLGGSFADVVLTEESDQFPNSERKLFAVTTHNWHVGAAYKLTKDLKAEAVYEFQNAVANRKIFDLTPTSADKRHFQAVHVGLIYGFWERFDTGIEYEWGRVKSFGSSEGVLNAINWRLRFYF